MLRSYRLGLEWQLLRMSAAQFLDAFRLALRHGWFASLRRASRTPEYATIDDGGGVARVLREREKHQLDLPYGPAAFRLGIGWLDPPWRTHPKGAGIAHSRSSRSSPRHLTRSPADKPGWAYSGLGHQRAPPAAGR